MTAPSVVLPPFVIIGGGISGVSCAQVLARYLAASASANGRGEGSSSVLLLSESAHVKAATNVERLTQTLEKFDVVHLPGYALAADNVTVTQGHVKAIDTVAQTLLLSDGTTQPYSKLCICSGARPLKAFAHPDVIVLRDSDTLQNLCERLEGARRVCIVGNGALAAELVYALTFTEVVWSIKDPYIGNTFFDSSASEFLMPSLFPSSASGGLSAAPSSGGECGNGSGGVIHLTQDSEQGTSKGRARNPHRLSPYKAASAAGEQGPSNLVASAASSLGAGTTPTTAAAAAAETMTTTKTNEAGTDNAANGESGERRVSETVERLEERPSGVALGPDWMKGVRKFTQGVTERKPVSLEFSTLLTGVYSANPVVGGDNDWPVYVCLSNGKVIGVDFLISAIGVLPETSFLDPNVFELDEEGAILVDEQMATNVDNVYAAGDCCAPRWSLSPQWFQMRLWSQARSMGIFAAQSMAGVIDSLGSGMTFELFSHTTYLFGYKVVLLGCYNAQKMGDDYKVLMRIDPGVEYIKLIMRDGRIHGALLIGETDLEGTFENLILNGTDVSQFGNELLDREAHDLEDFFD